MPSNFDYPGRYIEVEGYQLHYLDEGAGEPLLFLHGNPTWCYMYRNVIGQLCQQHRCIALDFLGFGLSEKPTHADYSLPKQVTRLALFIEQLDLRNITLCVHDIGGIVGLAWAAEHKDVVKRLVIMNTVSCVPEVLGTPRYLPPWSYLVLWPLRLPLVGEIMVQGLNLLQRVVMPLAFGNRRHFKRVVRQGYYYPYRTWSDRYAQLMTVRQIPILKSDPVYQLILETGKKLSGWQVPTQIIWGLQDPSSPAHLIRNTERILPNHKKSLLLAKAGHFLTEEQPEEIVDKIREFLNT
ncbi:alpha/beta fold hydrolase [Desulforamulus aeronauticus]|uniref:Haloalkane dehalogenase n=1 Tax=Desulforamulus aeronauticus DSM 10349 TaxID=1121421 RepID=A0A1M6RKU5_9FIRM|nr:alpha/beta fold hydrolase [Desulforamulus aeronauticus]SHK33064.1 haloalkane dehalogenase [Desulforamulus aeronauticus DSM 10349]